MRWNNAAIQIVQMNRILTPIPTTPTTMLSSFPMNIHTTIPTCNLMNILMAA